MTCSALVWLAVGCATSGLPEGTVLADAAPGNGIEETAMPAVGTEGLFADVTLAAGIRTRHQLPTEDLENIVDAVGAGSAFVDLDGDDWLDLVVAGGPRSPAPNGSRASHGGIRIYRNLQDGRFEDVTGPSGIPPDSTAVAVVAADYDGDGDRDLYLVDRGANRLLRNRGDAVFDDVTSRAGVGDPGFGIGAVFLDVDLDGDLDLYVANYLAYDPRQTAYYAPDGYPGPLTYEAERDVLYVNRGDGTFADVSETALGGVVARGMSVAAADFDEDGDTDIFVANDATENFLLLNDGEGRFVENALMAGLAMGENGEQTAAMAVDVGDVDGDGYLDLAVSDTAFGALYRRLRPGLFVDEIMHSGLAQICGQYVSWGQNLIDFDNDGDLDLFVVNGGLHHLVGWEDLLFRNDGRGRFEDVSEQGGRHFQARLVGRSSVAGDYDNDGDLDLFATTLNGHHVLLRNDHDGDESWITLDLVGRGNRDAFGSRVEVEAGGRTWVAESRCPTGYLGQGDPRVHFGLGAGVDRVDRVRITWPDGRRRVLEDVASRQILRVQREG